MASASSYLGFLAAAAAAAVVVAGAVPFHCNWVQTGMWMWMLVLPLMGAAAAACAPAAPASKQLAVPCQVGAGAGVLHALHPQGLTAPPDISNSSPANTPERTRCIRNISIVSVKVTDRQSR